MSTTELYSSVRDVLPGTLECLSLSPEKVLVRMPLIYSDGGMVEVYVVKWRGQYIATDFGEALGWLQMQTGQHQRTQDQDSFVEKLCKSLEIEFYRGQFIRRLDTLECLEDVVFRIAQAVVQISNLGQEDRKQNC